MCLEIYRLDLIIFCSPELAWLVALKKTKVKLDLLTLKRLREWVGCGVGQFDPPCGFSKV